MRQDPGAPTVRPQAGARAAPHAYTGGVIDLEAIWSGWNNVLTWFLVLAACAVGGVLVGAPTHALVLALLAVGVVLVSIGRTLLHMLEVMAIRRPPMDQDQEL